MKKKKAHFNDLLLPILAILCLLPFITYLKEYDFGYGSYEWHAAESIMQDLYTWYKMAFLFFVAVCTLAVLLFWMGLYKEKIRNPKAFLPFCIYLGFVLLSALFSQNPKAAWLGNFVDLQGSLMIAVFGLLAFYAYQLYRTDQDARTLLYGMEISFGIMSLIGYLQVFEKDLLQYEWMQRLVLPDAYEEYYLGSFAGIFSGNNVFLTLYNPNFAAEYLIMFGSVFLVFALYGKSKRQRISSRIFLIDSLILTWFTYTRAALLAVFIVLFVFLLQGLRRGKLSKKNVGRGALVMVVLVLLLLGLDHFAFGNKYLSRMISKEEEDRVEYLFTEGDTLRIGMTQGERLIYVNDAALPLITMEGPDQEKIILSQDGDSSSLSENDACQILLVSSDGSWQLMIEANGEELDFRLDESEGFLLESSWGKEVKIEEVSHVDLNGLESLGSGRLYIWSRILPLLPKRILLGSGQDTFAEVFPENDYSGKIAYSGGTSMIIERAHNDYLKIWLQSGLISLLAILFFYGKILINGGKALKNGEISEFEILRYGAMLACLSYMICSIFSDGTLYATPIFYIFAGLALSGE